MSNARRALRPADMAFPWVDATAGEELKADVAADLTAIPTIGAPGVSCWRHALEVVVTFGVGVIRVAMDADWPGKSEVADTIIKLCEAVTAANLGLEIESWDASDGKGIDDLLAAGKTPTVLSGKDATRNLDEIRQAIVRSKASPEIRLIPQTYHRGHAIDRADHLPTALATRCDVVPLSRRPADVLFPRDSGDGGLGSRRDDALLQTTPWGRRLANRKPRLLLRMTAPHHRS